MKKGVLSEFLAVTVTIVILLGLPFAITSYDDYVWKGSESDSLIVIKLYGRAQDGRWITERVNAWNYWHSDLKKEDLEVILKKGQMVRVGVTSIDVLHSFAFPGIREHRRPKDIYAGKWRVFDLYDLDEDEIGFRCWQYCSNNHQHMKGNLLVSYQDEFNAPALGSEGE